MQFCVAVDADELWVQHQEAMEEACAEDPADGVPGTLVSHSDMVSWSGPHVVFSRCGWEAASLCPRTESISILLPP